MFCEKQGKHILHYTVSEIDYSKIKILIADDVKLNIVLVQKALSFKPYNIITANNGTEAIELIKAENPDILLLDIMMPGLDGYEIIRRVRNGEAGKKDVRIVILSALNNEKDKQEGYDAGANDYLTKPIMIPHLLEVVNNQVEALLKK